MAAESWLPQWELHCRVVSQARVDRNFRRLSSSSTPALWGSAQARSPYCEVFRCSCPNQNWETSAADSTCREKRCQYSKHSLCDIHVLMFGLSMKQAENVSFLKVIYIQVTHSNVAFCNFTEKSMCCHLSVKSNVVDFSWVSSRVRNFSPNRRSREFSVSLEKSKVPRLDPNLNKCE